MAQPCSLQGSEVCVVHRIPHNPLLVRMSMPFGSTSTMAIHSVATLIMASNTTTGCNNGQLECCQALRVWLPQLAWQCYDIRAQEAPCTWVCPQPWIPDHTARVKVGSCEHAEGEVPGQESQASMPHQLDLLGGKHCLSPRSLVLSLCQLYSIHLTPSGGI